MMDERRGFNLNLDRKWHMLLRLVDANSKGWQNQKICFVSQDKAVDFWQANRLKYKTYVFIRSRPFLCANKNVYFLPS